MRVQVHFYSYFKDLAGCAATELTLAEEGTVADLLDALHRRFPRLSPLANSTLVAVGIEYQPRGYRLKDNDSVSLFPPVQGG
jgi:molybdopterin converting factor small subunit